MFAVLFVVQSAVQTDAPESLCLSFSEFMGKIGSRAVFCYACGFHEADSSEESTVALVVRRVSDVPTKDLLQNIPLTRTNAIRVCSPNGYFTSL